MTNPLPWVIIVADAIDRGIKLARALGHEPPGTDAAEAVLAELNKRAGQLLPAEVVALNFYLQHVARGLNAKIDALGESPRCPKCGAVAKQHALTTPGRPDAPTAITLSCDVCGWRS